MIAKDGCIMKCNDLATERWNLLQTFTLSTHDVVDDDCSVFRQRQRFLMTFRDYMEASLVALFSL